MTEHGPAHGRKNVAALCSLTYGYQCNWEICCTYLRLTVRCFEAYYMTWCHRSSQHKLLPSANFRSKGNTCQKRGQKVYETFFIHNLSGNIFKTVETWYKCIPLSEKANHSFIFSGNRKRKLKILFLYNLLKNQIRVNYIQRCSPYRTVNTAFPL
jgi:hypothetical protein